MILFPGYVEQLGKFTLKKFLLLVLFLDRAKLTRLIDHDPCLFNKEAAFKVCITVQYLLLDYKDSCLCRYDNEQC